MKQGMKWGNKPFYFRTTSSCFFPPNYDQELLSPEISQLQTICRVLLPVFQNHFALHDIKSFSQLLDFRSTLESVLGNQDKFQFSLWRSMIQPDLACANGNNQGRKPSTTPQLYSTHRSSAQHQVSELTCYVCQKTEPFCSGKVRVICSNSQPYGLENQRGKSINIRSTITSLPQDPQQG